ncbi:MAG: PTS sugar transporter subunit IIA, partial [Chitinivibrionales bacterium]
MAFYDYLKIKKIIDLKSKDKTNALTEMTRTLCRAAGIKKHKPLIEQVLSSEKSASSFIGQGIAIPKAKTDLISDSFAIAVGRAKSGIEYDAARNAKAYLIVLVFTTSTESEEYMSISSEISAFFKVKENRERFINENASADIVDLVLTFSENEDKETPQGKPKNRRKVKRSGSPVVDAAVNLIKATEASSMLVFADNLNDKSMIGRININKKNLVVVTENSSQFEFNNITDFVRVPAFSTSKRGQIKVGILLALS